MRLVHKESGDAASADKRIGSFLLRAGLLTVLLALFYVFFRFLLRPLLPFLLAGLIALIVVPVSEKAAAKLKAPVKPIAVVLLLLLSAALLTALFFAGRKLAKELTQFVSDENAILLRVGDAAEKTTAFLEKHAPALARLVKNEAFSDRAADMLSQAAAAASVELAKLAFSLPEALLFAVVTLLAAFYLTLDGKRLFALLLKLCPPRAAAAVEKFASSAVRGVLGSLKAGGLLMLLTFCVTLVGFLFLRAPFPLFTALLVAAVDFLPVLGTGTVLVPWSAALFFSGDIPRGAGMLVLWAATLLIRQFAEPRIVGRKLGVHPLAALFFTYAGLTLFGVGGMILLPVGASVLWSVFLEATARDEKDKQKKPENGSDLSPDPPAGTARQT